CRSAAALAIVRIRPPSPARSAARRAASNGACTASRARACASWNSRSGPVASDAPARLRPVRGAGSLRSLAPPPTSRPLRFGERSDGGRRRLVIALLSCAQQRAETARQGARTDALGAIHQALPREPRLELRRRPTAEELAHGERVMERGALIAQHDI